MSHELIQRRLVWGLALYEVFVIGAVAYAGISIATAGGSPLAAAVPVLVVAASEALRVPLSAWATRLSWGNRMLAIVVLLALAVASAEGLSLSFDGLIAARIKQVSTAGRSVETAEGDVAAVEQKAAPIKAALASAEKEIASLDAKHAALIATPPSAPGFSGTTCRSRRGATGGCPADAAAQRTYAAARQDYARQLTAIEDARKTASGSVADLQKRLAAIDAATPTAALALARRDLATVASESPMHRIASGWFDKRPAELTEREFAQFQKYAVTGLSVALATMSALVGWLAFQRPHDGSESQLSRALRMMIARRRKRVVAIRYVETIREIEVEKIVEKIVERPIRQTIIKHVPVSFSSGRHVQLPEREISAAGLNPIISKLVEADHV